MKTIRTAVFLSLLTLTASLFAAPQIAVYQNWDNVQVFEGDVIEYGSTEVLTPVSRLFRIHNTGNQTLNLSLVFTGSTMSVIEAPAATVAPGTYTTMRIRLYGDTPGSLLFNGYVTLNSNAQNDGSFNFSTHGSILGPLIKLQQAWSYQEQPNYSTFDFGTIASGTVTSRLFRIFNNGSPGRNLTLSNASAIVSGSGFVLIETPSSSIAPDGYTQFRVRFAPTAPNTLYDGTITIYSNDGPRSPYVIYLTGRSQ